MGFTTPSNYSTVDATVRLLGLGRQDSNLRSRDQNPVPCHLATPQYAGVLAPGSRNIARDAAIIPEPLVTVRPGAGEEGQTARFWTPTGPARPTSARVRTIAS